MVEFVSDKAPEGWAECLALSLDESSLRRALRVRLVAIAFGRGSSSQCRAIEMLLGMPGESVGDSVDDGELDAAEQIARRYLEARGYIVSSATEFGAAELASVRAVHNAGLRTEGSPSVDDARNSK